MHQDRELHSEILSLLGTKTLFSASREDAHVGCSSGRGRRGDASLGMKPPTHQDSGADLAFGVGIVGMEKFGGKLTCG